MTVQPKSIALVGNPNTGKTAIFNALTGANQKVGNWPGVTVEKKEGFFSLEAETVRVVDLPGTYSLNIFEGESALDETLTCNYLAKNCRGGISASPVGDGAAVGAGVEAAAQRIDAIVNVIDAAHLERNLYLTLQCLDLGVPVIVAVNMMDLLGQGIELNLDKLRQQLGCPVVGLVASRQSGFEQLRSEIAAVVSEVSGVSGISDSGTPYSCEPFPLTLPDEVTQAIDQLRKGADLHGSSGRDHQSFDLSLRFPYWQAVRLLEGDDVTRALSSPRVHELADALVESVRKALGCDPDIYIADARYQAIDRIALSVQTLPKKQKSTLSDRLDRIVLSRWLGIPVFLLVMYGLFFFSINVGGVFQDFFDISSHLIFVKAVAYGLYDVHAPSWLVAILAHGLGTGINTVLTFMPVLAAMFLFLSFLEDSGYMARAAFIMDKFMSQLGLPGKSFVPMIVGFGCNVPAIMGARTLSNRRDRILSILMMPFMSCGARLAIFAVFASAFFPEGGENIIFALYLIGILIAILTGVLLRKTLLRGEPAALVMELPSYHMPQLGALMKHTWRRLKGFVLRAGRLIVPICILIGTLNNIHLHRNETVLSSVGKAVTPVLSPMGIRQDNWPATVGLLTGVLAKEVVVGSLNTLYTQEIHRAQSKSSLDWQKGLRSALSSIPENLIGLGAAFKNPLKASESSHAFSNAAFGNMVKQFDGQRGAFAYLLFVLLYFPCVSTMAAMQRELNTQWTLLSVAWSISVAYLVSVVAYQSMTFIMHPWYSLTAIMAVVGYAMLLFCCLKYTRGLKKWLDG